MASSEIPKTMRALIAPKYCKPDGYQIVDLPVPQVERPNDVVVRVHAAVFITGESLQANGAFRFAIKADFPMTIGMEGAGVVVAVGSAVTSVRVGDEVCGGRWQRPVFPAPYPGWIAEYTVAPANLLVPKPRNLSFEEAAGLLGSLMTGYQSLTRGMQLAGLSDKSLEGKTVYIPGALSSTGSVGCQMAKNVFGAAKVISTVSTPKVPLVEELMPGVVDQVINYQKQDVVREVGRGTVDLVYNTQWGLEGTFPLLNPKTGVAVSIASVPYPALLKIVMGEKNVPFLVVWIATLMQWWYDFKLRGTSIKRDFISGHFDNREDVEVCGELLASGKIKPIMSVANFDDVDAVKRLANMVFTGKGGLGKMTVKIR